VVPGKVTREDVTREGMPGSKGDRRRPARLGCAWRQDRCGQAARGGL